MLLTKRNAHRVTLCDDNLSENPKLFFTFEENRNSESVIFITC